MGGSSGTAVAAALRYARRCTAEDLIVAFCPDTGRNYLSKMYDDGWMAENGFVEQPAGHVTVGDVLAALGRDGKLIYLEPDDTLGKAADLFVAENISQVPVVEGGQMVGAVHEITIMHALHQDVLPQAVRLREVMARPLPKVDATVSIEEAYRLLLAGNPGDRGDQAAKVALGHSDPVGPDALLRAGWTLQESEIMEFATRSIHVGQRPDPSTGATIPPISLSTTFTQAAPGEHKGYEYSRSGNPTRDGLEECLASLEEGEACAAFSSGLAASAAVFQSLVPGDGVVGGHDLYGGTYRLLEQVFRPSGLEVAYAADASPEAYAKALESLARPRLLWIETPTNPLLDVVDIRRACRNSPRPRLSRGRGQYLCDTLPAAAIEARGRPRGAQHNEVPGRPLRRRWRGRHRASGRAPGTDQIPAKRRGEPSRVPWTATWCRGA